ncbi:hypothetical protein [Oceanicoccus sagamiensis]|uniref:hypothetical protein n=1 Tax=Oceanicoccus sagamiensis TaxID=716816 RepID=UPI0012F4FDC9|nr:hypothetical protein [Oceanicoccus sagamiensis]
MTIPADSLANDNSNQDLDHHYDHNDDNHLAVKMAGQIRVNQKRRKLRAQRMRSRRR